MLMFLAYLRIIASIMMFSLASIQDIKEREVDDIIWIAGILSGSILNLYSFALHRPSLPETLQYFRFSIPFLVIIVLSWYLKLMGEADILAFISLSILQPTHLKKAFFSPAFCAMIYSSALMLLFPIFFLAWNLFQLVRKKEIFYGFKESIGKKAIVSLLAIAIDVERAKKLKYFSLAQEGVPPNMKFRLGSLISIPETKDTIPEFYGPLVWISPSIPMIPLILVGYVITLIVGDPIVLLMRLL